jgi:DNA-binding PadR family transcriptional regulator
MNDLLILSLLLAGPQHGYALKKRAGLISGQPAMHNNLVYPLLRRFVQNKWVKQKVAAGERGQTRQMYSLTALGRRVLVERLAKFEDSDARSAEAFHLRMGLLDLLMPETRREILDKRESHLKETIAKFARLETEIALSRYPKEVVRFLRQRAEAEVDWIERIRRIDSGTTVRSK